MHWDDMMHDKEYKPFNAYFDSKLANVHHCLELSRRLEGSFVEYVNTSCRSKRSVVNEILIINPGFLKSITNIVTLYS